MRNLNNFYWLNKEWKIIYRGFWSPHSLPITGCKECKLEFPIFPQIANFTVKQEYHRQKEALIMQYYAILSVCNRCWIKSKKIWHQAWKTICFSLKLSRQSSLISSLTFWMFWNFIECIKILGIWDFAFDPLMKIWMKGAGGECQCCEKPSVQPIKKLTKQTFTKFNVNI